MRVYDKVMIDGEEEELFIYDPEKDSLHNDGFILLSFDAEINSEMIMFLTIGYDYKGFDGAEYRKNKYFVYDDLLTAGEENFNTEEELFKVLREAYGQVIPEDTPELQEWRKLVASVR